jgi:hypothetical protein
MLGKGQIDFSTLGTSGYLSGDGRIFLDNYTLSLQSLYIKRSAYFNMRCSLTDMIDIRHQSSGR